MAAAAQPVRSGQVAWGWDGGGGGGRMGKLTGSWRRLAQGHVSKLRRPSCINVLGMNVVETSLECCGEGV